MEDVEALRHRVIGLQVQVLGKAITSQEAAAAEESIRFEAASLLHRLLPAQSFQEHYTGPVVCNERGLFKANIAFITRMRTVVKEVEATKCSPLVSAAPTHHAHPPLAPLSPPHHGTSMDTIVIPAPHIPLVPTGRGPEHKDNSVNLEEQLAKLEGLYSEREKAEQCELASLRTLLEKTSEEASNKLDELLHVYARVHTLSEFFTLRDEVLTEYVQLIDTCDVTSRQAVLLAELQSTTEAAEEHEVLEGRLLEARGRICDFISLGEFCNSYNAILASERTRLAKEIAEAAPGILAAVREHRRKDTLARGSSLTTSDLKITEYPEVLPVFSEVTAPVQVATPHRLVTVIAQQPIKESVPDGSVLVMEQQVHRMKAPASGSVLASSKIPFPDVSGVSTIVGIDHPELKDSEYARASMSTQRQMSVSSPASEQELLLVAREQAHRLDSLTEGRSESPTVPSSVARCERLPSVASRQSESERNTYDWEAGIDPDPAFDRPTAKLDVPSPKPRSALTFDTISSQDSLPHFLRDGQEAHPRPAIDKSRREQLLQRLQELQKRKEFLLQEARSQEAGAVVIHSMPIPPSSEQDVSISRDPEVKSSPIAGDVPPATEPRQQPQSVRKRSTPDWNRLSMPKKRYEKPPEPPVEEEVHKPVPTPKRTRSRQQPTVTPQKEPSRERRTVVFDPSDISSKTFDELRKELTSETPPASKIPRISQRITSPPETPGPEVSNPNIGISPPTVDLPRSRPISTCSYSRTPTAVTPTRQSSRVRRPRSASTKDSTGAPLAESSLWSTRSEVRPQSSMVTKSKLLTETQFELERRKAIQRWKAYEEKERKRQASITTTRDQLLQKRDQRIEEFRKKLNSRQGTPTGTPTRPGHARFEVEMELGRQRKAALEARRARAEHHAARMSETVVDPGLQEILTELEHDLLD